MSTTFCVNNDNQTGFLYKGSCSILGEKKIASVHQYFASTYTCAPSLSGYSVVDYTFGNIPCVFESTAKGISHFFSWMTEGTFFHNQNPYFGSYSSGSVGRDLTYATIALGVAGIGLYKSEKARKVAKNNWMKCAAFAALINIDFFARVATSASCNIGTALSHLDKDGNRHGALSNQAVMLALGVLPLGYGAVKNFNQFWNLRKKKIVQLKNLTGNGKESYRKEKTAEEKSKYCWALARSVGYAAMLALYSSYIIDRPVTVSTGSTPVEKPFQCPPVYV